MEKTNKYYGTIEKLVKEHKKFAGNEEFLDDIIDDVYSHSEVVINSISNESVIDAYLTKVVGTSIITVPKRLGKHQELKNKEPEPIQEIFRKNHVNTELVDKMINSAPKPIHEVQDILEDDVEEISDQADDDTCFEELNIKSENDEQIFAQEESEDSDVLELESPEESISLEDNNIEKELQENDLLETTSNKSLEKDEVGELELAFDDHIDTLETEELQPHEEPLDIDLDADSENESVDDDSLATVELDNNSGMLNIAEQEDIVLDDVPESMSLEKNDGTFRPTDYSVFNYNPEAGNSDVDKDEIANSICDLDRRKPDLNILKVYNLKYKENNTISEIASKLNMEEKDVKEAISELISVI